ncbi:MAG TPA: S8 family serine peptidase [Gaiellaceae bacterium]|nr:S8 family serine peptidase [Gaiellaceae bacterium]
MGWGRACGALVAALLVAAPAASAGGAGTARNAVTLTLKGSHRPYVPGQVVVRFRQGAAPSARTAALSAESATTVKRLVVPGLQLVHVRGSVADAVAALRHDPTVAYAEPNYLYHTDAVPNDPRFPQLWGLARIGAPGAWSITTGSSAVTVGIVDTGIATDHLDLSANVVPGHDFVQGDDDPRDFNGHGTHVAGTIGASGNNGRGVTGVNWQVGLMPVRVLDGSGSGSSANVTAGLAYACTHGASIVNASLGGTSYSSAMRDAIASCPNTLFVVAAGNDGLSDDTTPHYPCNYGAAPDDLPNVVCVAATDPSDTLASFSNYGRSVDLAAPGVNIPSTWPAYDALASDGFESLGGWTTHVVSGLAFGPSSVHTSGLYSATDSPTGTYQPDTDTWLYRTTPMASLAGRVGCRLFYNLRLDTQVNRDFFQVFGSADGSNFSGSQWSGSTGGVFLPLSSDMSAFDGAGTFYPGLRLAANGDGTVGDGGYVDDLSLRCLRASGEDYNTISGTSMATPHVAGVAALVKAAHPAFTVAQLKAALLGGVDRLGSLAGRVASGGRLNACRSLGGCGSTVFKPPCVVPNVVGKRLGAARTALKGRHCRVGRVAHVESTRKKKGKVLRESPAPGRRLGANAKVSLWLGRGR